MEEIEAILLKVLSDLAALPEDDMGIALFGKRLSVLSPEDAAHFFELLYRRNPQELVTKRVRHMLINPEGLKRVLGVDACRHIYLASLKFGYTRISRLFTDLPPYRKGLAGYDKEEEVKMEHISLGQRRAMSKRNIKDTIDRLLSDPDPVVIGNILNNPRVTEREVLKIASKRPNSPGILKLLSSHRVWSKRYAVIKAIAQNPYTPPRISVALLELMMSQDLRRLADDATVHPQVSLSAKDLLNERDKRNM